MTAETDPTPTRDPDEQSSRGVIWLQVFAAFLGAVVGVIVVRLVLFGFSGKSGFAEKTLWDYLDVFLVPVVVAVATFWLTVWESRRQRKDQENQQKLQDQADQARARDEALQAYLDQMSTLLLEKDLRSSTEDNTTEDSKEARTLARARTLTILPRLDGVRKRSVVQFLHETGLINKHAPVTLLDGADLSGTNLSEANLLEVSLSLANLRKADLNNAFLVEADLRGAQLQGANVRSSDLYGADLSLFTRTQETATLRSDKFLYTDLSNADLTEASLEGANLSQARLSEANLYQARLSEANLYQARLGEANLREADLSEAGLIGADLSGADLSGADLSGARLSGAGLSGADLSGADLSGADLRVWSRTGWPTNLRGAKGWTEEQLSAAMSLSGATMPDGQSLRDDYYIDGNPEGRPTFEEWLKSKGSGEDGGNDSPS
jgi:uncharacterized protein YjbI with pentapeptide repeats